MENSSGESENLIEGQKSQRVERVIQINNGDFLYCQREVLRYSSFGQKQSGLIRWYASRFDGLGGEQLCLGHGMKHNAGESEIVGKSQRRG